MNVKTLALVFFFVLGVTCQRTGDPCPIPTSNCLECAQVGCNWCKGSASVSACYASTETRTDICDKEANESPDEWITPDDPTQCCKEFKMEVTLVGGCGTAEDCANCASFEGCGYCHLDENGQTGCFRGGENGPLTGSCEAWTVGSCSLPCDNRENCQHCMDGIFYREAPCKWFSRDANDGRVGKCVFANNGTAEGTEIPDLSQCPLIPGTCEIRTDCQSCLEGGFGVCQWVSRDGADQTGHCQLKMNPDDGIDDPNFCPVDCEGRFDCQQCLKAPFSDAKGCKWFSRDSNDNRVGTCATERNSPDDGSEVIDLNLCPQSEGVSLAMMLALTLSAAILSVL